MTDAEILMRALNDEATEEEQLHLIDKILDALKLYDRHVQLGLEMQEANGDELRTLQAVRRYLSETAIPPWITMPIWLRITDLREKSVRKSNASLPEAQLWPKALAAAAISQYMLLGLRPLIDAADHVAALTGFDRDLLIDFRENTKKGKEKTDRKKAYQHSIEFLQTIPADRFDAEISEMLAQISAIPTERKRADRRNRK
ncbi:hypothetical protein [Mesorhizobium sp. AA23]|uniref:hypothetical protein n=1 Tax=Mesorhizobium sp. AA23 TaxID=1854058 RepID=UPI0007FC74F3|nr:hypothetical protein [Mesorhizobium sp. AA23]OBQ96805.1 hypothetical protein A9K66_20855 [Mesorhizobium sp. AA23]